MAKKVIAIEAALAILMVIFICASVSCQHKYEYYDSMATTQYEYSKNQIANYGFGSADLVSTLDYRSKADNFQKGKIACIAGIVVCVLTGFAVIVKADRKAQEMKSEQVHQE